MKQTIWDGKEVLMVEVPGGAYCIEIKRIYGKWKLSYFFDGDNFACIVLPGYWQFAFASPLSPIDIEAEEWVEKIYFEHDDIEWTGYLYYGSEDGLYFLYAIESLHSRIKSEGFPHPERVVLLTKK